MDKVRKHRVVAFYVVVGILAFLLGWYLPPRRGGPMRGEPLDMVLIPTGESFVPGVY